MTYSYDVAVIGGGPAGLAAACSAKENGAERVLVIERDVEVGGILNQCIHNGFGLHYFKEELTGPEYAERFFEKAKRIGIEFKTDTMVLRMENLSRSVHYIHAVNSSEGLMTISAKAVILAMGCRERTRGALSIAGDRPAGVFTAGTAQRYLNIEGKQIGKRVVILGSGDIGLIMARRLTLNGAKVLACVELCPYSNGLNRNIVQCLNDFGIPLYLSHTVTEIIGKHRVEKVVVSRVENGHPVPGSEMVFDCDTLLLSVGLIPENELSRSAGIGIDSRTNGAVVYENRETLTPGVFACGNVLHVHDIVDFVTEESIIAGSGAAAIATGKVPEDNAHCIEVKTSTGIRYTVPQKIRPMGIDKCAEIFFRVTAVFGKSKIVVRDGDRVVCSYSRQHMAPGEMEKIAIPKTVLEGCSGVLSIETEVEND